MSELDILEFEFKEPEGNLKYFVKVMDVFTHHFTNERMWHVRIDCEASLGVRARSYFDCLNEDQFKRIASQRVNVNVEGT